MVKRTVTVFGSGEVGEEAFGYQQAQRLGKQLAERGYRVCSGGYQGIMQAVSQGAREEGGEVIGITSQSFSRRPNAWVSQVEEVPTWKERLFRLIDIADAYVVMDGGSGTLTEWSVVWEMALKHKVEKPIFVLGDFYRELHLFLSRNNLFRFPPTLYCSSNVAELIDELDQIFSRDSPENQ